eukprot:2702845-Prymnesium_polylepis.1
MSSRLLLVVLSSVGGAEAESGPGSSIFWLKNPSFETDSTTSRNLRIRSETGAIGRRRREYTKLEET